MLEYLLEDTTRRFAIGILDKQGTAGESISIWLDNGRLTLAQARAIAGHWKADRHAGRDPMAEREARLAALRTAEEAQRGVLGSVAPCRVHDLRRTLIARLPDRSATTNCCSMPSCITCKSSVRR